MKINIVIDVDKCIAKEIQDLNRKGIKTAFCCCGHNLIGPDKFHHKGYISICDDLMSVRKMIRLGYKISHMQCEIRNTIWWNEGDKYENNLDNPRIVRNYTFYPKSKCHCKPRKWRPANKC